MEETLNAVATPQQTEVVQAQAAPTSTEPAQDVGGTGTVTAETSGGNTQGQYVLRVDENGRRTFAYEPAVATDAPEQKQEEQAAPEQPVATEQPPVQGDNLSQGSTITEQVTSAFNNVDTEAVPKYNLKEFSTALATNTIDERRIPEQFKDRYIDYTIQKAQRDYDAFMAEQARQKELVEQQLNQKPDPAKQQEFYTKLNEEARNRALADLGISPEDYKAKEFEDEAMVERFEAAKEWHRNKLINELQSRARSEEANRNQQANIIGQITAYVREQRAKEPHFDEIDRMMGTLYKELPYGKAVAIADAITAMQNKTIKESQLATLQEYYEIGRQMYYAKRNGLPANNQPKAVAQPARQQPPVVEQSGNGQTVNVNQGPTVTDMRNARSTRERNNILYQLLQAKQIKR